MSLLDNNLNQIAEKNVFESYENKVIEFLDHMNMDSDYNPFESSYEFWYHTINTLSSSTITPNLITISKCGFNYFEGKFVIFPLSPYPILIRNYMEESLPDYIHIYIPSNQLVNETHKDDVINRIMEQREPIIYTKNCPNLKIPGIQLIELG